MLAGRLLLVAGAALLALPVSARTSLAPTPQEVQAPRWIRAPQVEYPAQALSLDVKGGRVRLTCVARLDQTLSDCRVVNETPEGVGFAEAALAATADARVQPRLAEGELREAPITFLIEFRLTQQDPPTPPPDHLPPRGQPAIRSQRQLGETPWPFRLHCKKD